MLRIVVASPPRVGRPDDLAASLPASADVIELRLDALPCRAWDEASLRSWVAASPRPVLATLRSRDEGGGFDGSPPEAARILEAAAHAGARYLDVEPLVAAHVSHLPPGVDVIASHHGSRPLDLPLAVAGRPVVAWKVARPVDDRLALERLVADAATPAPVTRTLVPYGALGHVRGAFVPAGGLLYGSAAPGEGVVAGQPSLDVLLDELRAGEVTRAAVLYGLLGRPPSRSPSPAMHNAAFRRLGLDALYVPLPGLGLEAALDLPFAGLSVTTPFKIEALRRAATAEEAARRAGAANTLLKRPGGWHALNTDVLAVAAAVPDGAGAGALVYGAGGYARAAASALEARGYAVRVAARDGTRAQALAREGGWACDGTTFQRRVDDRVLCNATPAGVAGALPEALALGDYAGMVVLDAPYPDAGHATALAASARATAARLVDGRELLRLQARGQVRAFTGHEIEDVVLDLALEPPASLLLLGLRGAGKTTVGRRLAHHLGRPFVDLDEEVARITGRSPAAWLRAEGESAFRRVELGALARNAGRRGVVLAAGGGVLEHPGARDIVREHTVAAWLDLPSALAAARVGRDEADRPRLVTGTSVEEEARLMLARRRATWQEEARFVVDAAAPVDVVVESLAKGWTRHARTRRAP